MKLFTQHQLLNTAEAIKNYYENNPDTAQEMVKKHLMNLAPVTKKRTLIIYNTKETTEEEARHLLEILNCDDSTLWDNADHCGVQVIEVPIDKGEVPSDEEIDKANGYAYYGKPDGEKYIAFNEGAKWMRDKIQGGNK